MDCIQQHISECDGASGLSRILITGGAGFIGVHSARYFSELGWQVTVIDNLSRRGAPENLAWLKLTCSPQFIQADIRDRDAMETIVGELHPDVLLHLAAQVAVTTSVDDPRADFEANALGTFNMLEAVRRRSRETFFVNASTNKVYGRMEDLGVVERDGRYEYRDLPQGVGEERALDFHSPYGCSKGVADQYTIDYSRIYDLDTVTFRQSCIYGTRQFGVEDQGWVAWFTIASVLDKPITIYGDGKQIRDVLHVGDLVRAYEAAYAHRADVCGQAFNIGGGPANTMSLRELIRQLEQKLGKTIPLKWSDWRPGDQPVFVCNVAKAQKLLGWNPSIAVHEGVDQLIGWTCANRELFEAQ